MDRPPDAVALLRVIRAAERLGFSLEKVAELPEAGRHHHDAGPRNRGGLQDRAAAEIAEIDGRTTDVNVIRAALARAVDAGCDDLAVCAAGTGLPPPVHRTRRREASCRILRHEGRRHDAR